MHFVEMQLKQVPWAATGTLGRQTLSMVVIGHPKLRRLQTALFVNVVECWTIESGLDFAYPRFVCDDKAHASNEAQLVVADDLLVVEHMADHIVCKHLLFPGYGSSRPLRWRQVL